MWRNSTHGFLEAFLFTSSENYPGIATNINSKRALYLDNHLAQRLSKKKTHWMHIRWGRRKRFPWLFFFLSTFIRWIWRLHWDVSRFEREQETGKRDRRERYDEKDRFPLSFCWPNIFYLFDTHFFLVSLNTSPEKSPHREAICHHFLYFGHGTWFQASATEDPGAVSVHVTR